MAEKEKEVRMHHRYRLFIRDDNGQVFGCEKTDGNGDPDLDTLIDYGNSVTYTWVLGKYYHHNDPADVKDKWEREELDDNYDQRLVELNAPS